MGLKEKEEMPPRNGQSICDLCYKDGESHRNVGSVIFFRTDEADVRLDILPLKLWSKGEENLIGNFIPSEKVPDAPFIEGDVTAPSDERGKRIKVGHIHTDERPSGEAYYWMTLFGIPVGAWRKIILATESGSGKRSMFLKVEME